MKNWHQKQLSRYILATLTVGMFGIVPVAHALPVAITDGSYTNTAGTATNTVASQMNITGSAANNVMNWKTFSIANGEKVQFDEKNYLNLVRGTSKSEIDGALSGTGNIYLINPNGILFGSTAQVNVGNLVASTRAIDKVDADGFAASGANPLTIAATAAAGDIVNLGKLQAASVTLEGNNITIQNAADITSNGSTALTSAVTVKAAGNITVGHAVAATTTRSFTIGGTATDKTVHDYANATVAASGYTATNLAGANKNVKESMLVDNVYDLQNMDANLDGNYMLAGNIDASETSSWSDAGTMNGAGFSPVGNDTSKFTGAFDGANHTINGLYINRPTTNYVGLFGNSTGTIQKVGLVGGSITGEYVVGGVVGQNSSSGKITNVYNTGAVKGNGNYVGGVVGWNDGTIQNTYNTGAVSGTNDVGGVAGYNSATITNAYNTGAVSGNDDNAGGVAGQNDGTIQNTYNMGAVSGTNTVGGVVGQNDGTIQNTYNMGAVSGTNTVGGVVGQNHRTITNAYNTGVVSGTNTVGGVAGYNSATITNAYNTGVVSGKNNVGGVAGYNSATITNAYNTGAVSGTGDYVGGVAGYNSATITNAYNTGAVSGTGDYVGGVVGRNYGGTITNAYNTGVVSGTNDVGGVVGDNGGTITNVYNTGAVSGTQYVGGVVGNNYGTITNVYNTGAVSGKKNYVGGVVGRNYGGTITNAYNTGAVSGTQYVGGVVGDNSGTITNAYNTGAVRGTGVYGYVGGVAGQSYSGTITNAYNTGAVSGTGDYVGGVAGQNRTTITNTYNTGAVSGTAQYVGGVAGWNLSVITDAYNTGAVSGTGRYVGGVAGQNSATITNTYNTGSVSGTYVVGGVVGQNNGKIENTYNTGSVTGMFSVGGVAGVNVSTITDVYNTGIVTGTGQAAHIGGVVGWNDTKGKITNAYNTGAVSGTTDVGGVAGTNVSTITDVYNTGIVTGTGQAAHIGGVVGWNDTKGKITNAYNTGAVSGTTDVGGVAGTNADTITNTWYATTDAAGNKINTSNASGIGTAKTLTELQGMALGDTGYGFDTTIWRKNDTDGSTALVATTPMLQAFINKELDSQITHTAVQYGTAEKPLVNIYQTSGDVTLDMSTLTRNPNVGAAVYGHNLTVANFTSAANDSSTWASYEAKDERDKTKSGNLYLNNDNGFTVNKNMELLGTNSITLSAKNSSTGTIIDYGKNTTPTLKITAKDIVLDTDRVNTAAGGSTAVTLDATGTAKAGYTPKNTMTATVNGVSVSVPDYVNSVKRTYYPSITATNNNLSEGRWIKNVTELQAMGTSTATLGKTYFLYGDIDASATKTWNQDTTTSAYKGFVPVGEYMSTFTGIFDGLNHTINNLYIYRPSASNVGLFGFVNGKIKNVGLAGGNITGQTSVGGVVGRLDSPGSVTNAYNTGAVSGTDDVVGGVVGRNVSGTITNTYNTGAVSGTDVVGGVVGHNQRGKITNAYNTGAVSGTNKVGGVVGVNASSGTITNTYNTGTVSGNSSVGGVVGYNLNGTITNALWANDYTSTTAGKPTTAVGDKSDTDTEKGVTLADMKKAATYDSWKDDSDKEIVVATGNAGTAWRIYEGRTTPLLTSFFKGVVTVTGLSNQTVTYNGTTQKADLSSATYSPANIDASHILAGSGRNAGTYSAIYSDQQGYDLVNTSTLTISPKTLTATLTGKTGDTYVFTKTYDGTTSVTKELVLGDTYTFDNAVSGDTVSIAANSSGIYADKNVGDGKNAGDDKTISFTGITLTGADAGNYTIADTLSGNVGQITKKNITASLNTLDGSYVFTKTYDGGTDVKQALGTNYSFAAGDIESVDTGKVSLTAGAGVYTDKNVENTKKVTFGNLVLGGDEARNYNLTTTSLTGNVGQITAKELTITLAGNNTFTKEYDGTTAVNQTLDGNYTISGIVGAEKVDLDSAGVSGSYADKNAADGKQVQFTVKGLTGDDKANYSLKSTTLTGNVGQITAKELTITLAGNNTFTKEYDGTTKVNQDLAGNYTISGIVGTEKVDLNSAGVIGSYADKNAADGKQVQFTVKGLTGDDKANYSLKSTTLTGNVGKITPKALTATLTGDNAFTKVYDGTTTVSQTLGTNYALDGIVSDSDKVLLSAGSGAYNDKNAGDNKTVTFSGLTLTGAGAGNYSIASTLSGAVGRITKKSLVAEMNNGASFTKVYDGTTAVNTALVLDSNYAFAEGDVVTGDAVSIDAAKAVGAYADKNAGSNKAVNFTNLTLTGADAGNYELLDMEMGIDGASITPKTLTATLTGDNVFTKVYDGTTAVSQTLGTNYALDGIVADSDKVSLTAGSGAYNDKNVGDNKTITFSGLTLGGEGAGNYTIASTLSGAVGQITRRTITGSLASGYSFDKVYDGTATASLGNGYTLSGVVAGDNVPLTAAKGFYDSSAVGDRTVTFSGFSINDGNYLLSMAGSLTGTGKISSGSQDHNYSDALTGVSSFFGANPSDGCTIFSGAPEDYIPRAVSQNDGQSYQVGVAQVTQTWYNGPTSLTIINGGITLPKDILLGSTSDTRTVVIKGGDSYQI